MEKIADFGDFGKIGLSHKDNLWLLRNVTSDELKSIRRVSVMEILFILNEPSTCGLEFFPVDGSWVFFITGGGVGYIEWDHVNNRWYVDVFQSIDAFVKKWEGDNFGKKPFVCRLEHHYLNFLPR